MSENKNLTQQVITMTGINPRKCMKCGKCSGACPAYDEMEYHPHQFVSMVEKGKVEALMQSQSIWMCLSCFACVERCPRGVEPARFIEAARLALIRQPNNNHLKAEDVPGKVNDQLPQQAIVSAYRKYSK